MPFPYETDLLKHHIRLHGWLPVCRRRLRAIRDSDSSAQKRRLKYFTFCAIGAIDVLMLDVARVVRPSAVGFDTVFFFDKSPEAVAETSKRIPGATGFPGDFTSVILLDDPLEDDAIDSSDPLVAPEQAPDDRATRAKQNLAAQRRDFIQCFPFDVINLDLEEFLFKPTDPLPGRVVNAMKKIFVWQQRPFIAPNHRAPQTLSAFTLMFTTRIGPPNISDAYLEMLRSYLDDNLKRDANLMPVFAEKTKGCEDARTLEKQDFDLFFELAVPKVIAGVLKETDWCVDPANGILIYEFERQPEGKDPYKILHMVMDVVRQDPPHNRRPPGLVQPNTEAAYAQVARKVFTDEVISVSYATINKEELQASLDTVILHRRKYYQADEN